MTGKTTRSKKQVEEADKSKAATGDLVADTGTEQGQAKPDTATEQVAVTEQAAQREPAPQEEEEKEASDTEQQVNRVDVGDDDAELILAVDANQPGWVIGHMDVKAKSPNGFWRCGCRFVREKATRVYVVTSRADIVGAITETAYVTPDEARRIYREPNLTILVDGDVIRG